MRLPEPLARVVAFLEGIGLEVQVDDAPVNGFVAGVSIAQGVLRVGPNATVDGLLHEAGHLAITPRPFRAWMDGNVAAGQRRMLEAVGHLDPDVGIGRHALQASDTEATAWAFAAGRALGFADEDIITQANYQGDGAHIRVACALGAYLGVRGLVAAGLCTQGLAARRAGVAAYPAMRAWIQDGPYPEWDTAPSQARPGP